MKKKIFWIIDWFPIVDLVYLIPPNAIFRTDNVILRTDNAIGILQKLPTDHHPGQCASFS
jgi:hypothetical protein